MKQPIRRRVAEANGIDTKKYYYSCIFDMNNIMKIASVDHKMNNDGKEYGIILTSLRLIGDVLRKKDFDYCIAAYDGEGSGVLRWQLYKDYKANRDKNYEAHNPNKTDYDKYIENYTKNVLRYSREKSEAKEKEEESFARQKEILQEILDELCIRQYEFENVEGDDIISYYVKTKRDNEKIVIVSSDKDLTQLISDTVIVYNPRLKDFITKDNAVEKLDIIPENIVLEKVICGDVSDNIKGVKGVGNDTLIKLVTDGCQGDRLYEINQKIIDLSVPLLTNEAKESMDEESYAPIDTSDRSIKNVYNIVTENKINDILDERKFGDILEPFTRIITMENKHYGKFKEENGRK